MSDNTPNSPQMSEVVETTWLKPSLYGGRFTRKQYFWRLLLVSVIVWVLNSILLASLLTSPTISDMVSNPNSIENYQQAAMQVSLIVSLPVSIFIYLPFGLKRAHDIGHKGTFLITLFIISLIAQILEAFVGGELFTVLSSFVLIPAAIYGLVLLFSDSEKGTNAYGTSTKYPDTTA